MEATKVTYTKEQIHEIMETIVSIVSKEIPKLNQGGCGWFVHYILKEFERYGIHIGEYWVVYLVDYGLEDEEEIEYNLRNRCGKRSCSHIMIKYDDVYYDGYYIGEEVEHHFTHYPEFLVKTNAKDMRAACEYRPDWNRRYKYKKYNSRLRDIIYSTFKKVLLNG